MQPETPHPRDSRAILEVGVVTALALAAVVLVDRNGALLGPLRALPWVPAIWIYLPLAVLWWRRLPLERYGLSLAGWRGGLVDGAAVLALLIPAYVAGHLAFRVGLQGHSFVRPDLSDLGELLTKHGLAIGLPEEMFFRGYVLTRLMDALGPGRRLWGGNVGAAVVLSAIVFNAAHPIAGGSWWQGNVPFGILLGWLWCRRGNLVAPTLVHAVTNVVFVLLERGIR